MKAPKLAILFLVVIIITVSLTAIVYTNYFMVETEHIPITATVGERLGFDVDVELPLPFGEARPGDALTRMINVSHDLEQPALVSLVSGGELGGWTVFSENNFILEEGERKEIRVRIEIPKQAPLGDYTGYINIYLKRI
jgi:hypothetical protein